MAHLPPSSVATVTQFAQQMDIDAYEAPDGAYSFDFERSGRLSILATDGGQIVVSLTGKLLLEDIRGFAALCGQGGYDAAHDQLIHSGLNKAGQPVLAIQTGAREFTMPFLQESFTNLAARLESAGF